MKLSWSNRNLTIDPVRREDAGNYQCEVSNPISSAESEAVEKNDHPPSTPVAQRERFSIYDVLQRFEFKDITESWLKFSLLNVWSLPTTAQLAIVSTNAAEGQNVTLRIDNMPPDVRGFMWYRGEEPNYKDKIASLGMLPGHRAGPAHSGREQVNFDGSLLIKSVTLKDTGNYTILVYRIGSKKEEIGFGQLNVYERVRVPTLLASKTTLKERTDSVILICYTNAVSVQWFFNGMNLQLTRRKKLSWNDRTLTIDPVWRADSGNYHCNVSNPISFAASDPVKLDVKCW
ncbi:cell adhesion molecule CEACAM21-like [Myotis yumanensis]|uniref:cell adhesion molecule CEACAM21-like n=1 Tax=Myotis yumanensis TaxID=159337 RepID=UPI0038D431D4